MFNYYVQRSTEELKFIVYKDFNLGSDRSVLTVKQYTDGHLDFVCSSELLRTAYFFDHQNASDACDVGNASMIRICRQKPREYAELTINGIRCAMDAYMLEKYIENNPKLIAKYDIELENNI